MSRLIQVTRDMVDTIAYTPRGTRAWQQETLGEASDQGDQLGLVSHQ